MTSSIKPLFSPLFAFLAALLVFTSQKAEAQHPLNDAQQRALTALESGDWQKALSETTQTISDFGSRGKTLWGARFGWFYYMQGYSMVKLGQFEPAMESFKICHEQYKNIPPERNNPVSEYKNPYEVKSVLRWAEAAVYAKQYDVAVDQYQRFLKIRTPEEKFNPGSLYLNLGISYLKMDGGDAKKGVESLETAIANKVKWRTPDSQVMKGFGALIEYCLKVNNQQLAIDFITKNRADIELSPYVRQRYAPLFMKQANEALEKDMNRVAFLLYGLVPSTQSAISDLENRLAAFTPRNRVQDVGGTLDRNQLEAELKVLRARQASGRAYESTALQFIAIIHEKMGNPRAAFAAYEQLELFYSKNKNREANLYNLVRT